MRMRQNFNNAKNFNDNFNNANRQNFCLFTAIAGSSLLYNQYTEELECMKKY